MRRIIAGAIAFLMVVLFGELPAAASDKYTVSIANYLQATFGSTAADVANLTTLHVASTPSCPAGYSCIGGTFALVTFSEGDGGGQALMVVSANSRNPNAFVTVMCGGGIIGYQGLLGYGLTSSQALYLVSH